MRLIGAAVLLLVPAVSHTQLVPDISLGARLVGESPSDVTGEIDYFKGTDPTPAYRESVGAGVGLGAEAGYQVHRRVHLSLGVDVTRHSAERESAELSKTLFQLSSLARFAIGSSSGELQPYLTAGLALRNLHDGEAASGPWPRTESVFGDAVILGGGVQRSISQSLRLDAGVQFAWTSYESLTADGRFEKETGAEQIVLPQAHVGIAYRPAAPVAALDTRDVRAPRAGERVRVHSGARNIAGEIVALSTDSLVLQVRRGGRFDQIALPVACIDAVDAFAGRRTTAGASLSGAIRAMAIGTAGYLVLMRAGESRFPNEQRKAAAFIVAPSAIIGALIGSRGSRDLWTARPLGWQTRSAPGPRTPCPELL